MRPTREDPDASPEPGSSSEAARSRDPQAVDAREGAPRCRACGAPLAWDPARAALACAYCGGGRAVERGTGLVLERPLSAAGEAARGFGLELRAVHCRTCGARVALAETASARTCDFCGSGAVLAAEAARNALRPESLIPLEVCREKARDAFRGWARALWFRPSALARAELSGAHGIYVPYWTFDAQARSSWEADAGYHYWVSETRMVRVGGRLVPRQVRVRHTRWVRSAGRRSDHYDDLAVCGSRGLSTELVRELGAFDLEALVPYRPEYLAGWHAEEYQLDLAGAWEAAREEILATQRRRCAGDVPGDTQRGLSVRTELDEPRWKLVLLPVWSLVYRHGGRDWPVLVHGQKGRVVGRAPLSWVKIALCALAASAVVGLAALALALAAWLGT